MIRIRMLSDRKGSSDGWIVVQYNKDQVYEVSESLARDFFRFGWAVKEGK